MWSEKKTGWIPDSRGPFKYSSKQGKHHTFGQEVCCSRWTICLQLRGWWYQVCQGGNKQQIEIVANSSIPSKGVDGTSTIIYHKLVISREKMFGGSPICLGGMPLLVTDAKCLTYQCVAIGDTFFLIEMTFNDLKSFWQPANNGDLIQPHHKQC